MILSKALKSARTDPGKIEPFRGRKLFGDSERATNWLMLPMTVDSRFERYLVARIAPGLVHYIIPGNSGVNT
jgi:hypothetical protein